MNRIILIVAALVALPAALPAQATQPRPDPPEAIPSIVVSGTGEATARPDRAVVTIGASAEAKDAAAAQTQVNQIVTHVLEQIRALGIPESAIQTSGLDLQPEYANPRPGERPEPRISGYRAGNMVSVRVDDLTRIGPVVDAAVNAGANQIQGVTFQLKDDTAQRQAALRQAAQQARTKAETIATAMGVGLGQIQEVVEEGASSRPRPLRMAAMSMDAAATPVQAGELSITASLTVRYRIVQPPR